MATTSLKLSRKTDANGRSQVIVKLTVSRTNRPCFKSGVFISPDWFKPISEKSSYRKFKGQETWGDVKSSTYGVFVPKKGKLNVVEVREAEAAKTALDGFVSRLTAVCNALSGHGDEVTHDNIEEAMNLTRDKTSDSITFQVIQDLKKLHEEKQNESANTKTFFEWLDFYLQKKELSEGRKRGFRVLVRMLSRYQLFVRQTDKERKDFTLDVHTIDRETLEDFFDYASNEKTLSEENPELFKRLLADYPVEFSPKHKKRVIEERGRNIIIGRKKSLKAFFNWMLEQKYTTNRPFEGITIGSEVYGRPYYLTLEERNAIADHDFSNNKHLEVQRDIFIFQSLIGCRVSDLLALTPKNLIDGSIQYIPRKTKDEKPIVVTVPLNNRATALVEKYKGVDSKGRLFPFISSQKYNDSIKEILTACEVKRMVTIINPTTGAEEQHPINELASSHMARRTFIGNIYKKVKDPNLIGVLSGHSEGSKSFARYRDIDDETKKETVSLID